MATYSYPGVYIKEVPSGVRTISGVSTSDTAFVGFFKCGPMKKPVRITSFSDFERDFGGLDYESEASYAIQQYYQNGGQIAWVVRTAKEPSGSPSVPAEVAKAYLKDSINKNALKIEAASEGLWGNNIQVSVTYPPKDDQSSKEPFYFPETFNMFIEEIPGDGSQRPVNNEVYYNLSMDKDSSNYVVEVIEAQSLLIRVTDEGLGSRPCEVSKVRLEEGSDGQSPDVKALIEGMNTLDTIVFNILCLPAGFNLRKRGKDEKEKRENYKTDWKTLYKAVYSFCDKKRAFLIVDTPAFVTHSEIKEWAVDIQTKNAAIYFPCLQIPDQLKEYRPREVGVSGTLAGIYARTDNARGIWKAPAGTEATLRGATPVMKLTDLQTGGLNQLGINALRILPVYGNVSWGARTLRGADQMASEWKYISVRRLALYIEESLYQALQWVVFEPNDEPLWSQIRLNVGAFMQNLFRQGAFQGSTPNEGYFVRCDQNTTTQHDIDRGIVNVLVGFAPLKPAEFVVVKLQQMAGQSPT